MGLCSGLVYCCSWLIVILVGLGVVVSLYFRYLLWRGGRGAGDGRRRRAGRQKATIRDERIGPWKCLCGENVRKSIAVCPVCGRKWDDAAVDVSFEDHPDD